MNKRLFSYHAIALAVSILFNDYSFAQTLSGKNIFIQPLDSEIILAGTFGEIRTNHFHSGIDISTGGEEGKRVMAAADGYVSRIKVSAVGFGKALYITHPTGYVTVYGHLQRFNDSLEKYVRSEQYRKESFEVELFPGEKEFVVRQRDLIAYSGNTGGSSGPHLHFEIRDGKTEEPQETDSFGFTIQDTIPPVLNSVAIYPIHGTINKNCGKIILPLKKMENIYSPAEMTKINISGETGFGIEVTDKQFNNEMKLGINKIELFIDEKKIYDYSFGHFSFAESRFVNANIDYGESVRTGKTILLCFRLPGNEFSMTKKDGLSGIINFKTEETHTALFRVYDFNNNISQAAFNFSSTSEKIACPQIASSDSVFLIAYDKPFVYSTTDLKISTDKLPAVYENTYLNITRHEKQNDNFSNTFSIGSDSVPIHNSISLSVMPENLPTTFRTKALIVKIENTGRESSAGGNFTNGFVNTKINSFGSYAVAVDTTAPFIGEIITHINQNSFVSKEKQNVKQNILILIKIKDELSGVATYRATVNGQWLLMEYDAKTGMLSGDLSISKSKSKQKFVLTVTDKKGNQSRKTKLLSF